LDINIGGKMKHSRKPDYKGLLISLIFTLVVFIFSLGYFDAITAELCFNRLLFPLARLIFFISVGLFAGQIIESFGWTRQVAVLARPFFRFSNLGDRCSAAFTTAFISGASANAMLLDFYKDGKITRAQLFLSNYINQFPAYFLHLPTTVFIVLPLTGYAGVLYFVITFLATLLRTACFLVFGRLYLKGRTESVEHETSDTCNIRQASDKKKKDINKVLAAIREKLPARIINIVIWVLPVYTLVFILNVDGFFTYLNKTLAGVLTVKFMPVQSLSIVVLSFAAEFTSGFAAAGALMHAGVITVPQTVAALLSGNVLAFPIRALRHQLPRYMGIFSPKMGLQLLLSGQLFRVASIIIVGTLYYMAA